MTDKFNIDRDQADTLAGVVALPLSARTEVLGLIAAKMSKEELVALLSNVIGVANAALENSAEMVDLILLGHGIGHPDRPQSRANLPTMFGAFRGIVLADGIDQSKLCGGCAYRLGTAANMSPITTDDADYCATDDGVGHFLCHEELNHKGRPFKACAGYAMDRKRKDAPQI